MRERELLSPVRIATAHKRRRRDKTHNTGLRLEGVSHTQDGSGEGRKQEEEVTNTKAQRGNNERKGRSRIE